MEHGFSPAIKQLHLQGFFGRVVDAMFDAGGQAVSFFFVLSGFLITYLLLTESRATRQVDVRAFYIRRALRIWPLYFLVLGFGLMLYPLMKKLLGFSPYIDRTNPLYYLCFLTNLQMVHQRTLHGAMSLNIGWSVSVEEQFYLIWPLLFLLLRPRHYAYIFLAIVGASALFRSAHFNEPLILKFHTLSVISDMAIGGLAAYLMATSTRAVEAARRWPRAVILLGYGIGFSVVLASVHPTTVSTTWAVLGRLLCTLFFAFVIIEQSYGEHSLVKAGRFRKPSEMGKYSYGLYLIHPIAITLVLDLSRLHREPTGSFEELFLIGLAALGLTIVLSSLSYRLYEQRFLMLKQRFAHIQSGG